MTIAPPDISDPLAQEAPHAAAAAEVGLDDDAVCRIGDGIVVQIVDARALVLIPRADVREDLPILEILNIHALVEVAVPRKGGLGTQDGQQLGVQQVKVLLLVRCKALRR
jgi:hypothetical protein